jgi:hypothetical protein
VLVAWVDARNLNTDIYVQRVRSDGSIYPGWPAAGAAATNNFADQDNPRIASDGLGGAYVVWNDFWTYNFNGRIQCIGQHVTASGSVHASWPQDGLQISPFNTGRQLVVGDGAGGCFVSWTDGRRGGPFPGYDVYAQHLLPDGSPATGWQLDGKMVSSAKANLKLDSDGEGGFYVSSTNYSDPFTKDQFWVSRFSADGSPAAGWSADGLLLTPTHEYRDGQVTAADSMGGVIAAWDENSDIFAVRVLPNGAVAPGWSLGGTLVSSPSLPNEYQADVTPDGNGGAYFSWQFVTGATRGYAQHLSSHGTVYSGWPAGGIQIATTIAQYDPKVAHDGFGNAIVYWAESGGRSSIRNGIFAQKFVVDGIVATQLALASSDARPDRVTLVWQGNGASALDAQVQRMADSGAWQTLGRAERDGSDRLIYQDNSVRPGSRYAYRLAWTEGGEAMTTTEAWIDVPNAAVLALEGLRPNPAVDAINVSFSLASSTSASLELLDLAGRRVADREVGTLGAGRHLLRLNPSERVAPGVYWLRLRQGEQQLLARAVVMR